MHQLKTSRIPLFFLRHDNCSRAGNALCRTPETRDLCIQEQSMQLLDFQDKYGLTVHEAVKVLGICERKVRELIAQDEIPHFRVGRAVRIPWQPLKEWMDNGGTGGVKQ